MTADERAYPIDPAPADDQRFDMGLLLDVARVLEQHGYPPVRHGRDLLELRGALFGFLYRGTA